MRRFDDDDGLSTGHKVAMIAAGGAVALTLGILVVAWLAPEDPEGLAVCSIADPATGELVRVEDSKCGDFDEDGHVTYAGGYSYMVYDTRAYSGSIAPVGGRLPARGTRGFVRTYPKGMTIGKGVPSAGGSLKDATSTVQRGGFGVKGAGKGGGG